MSKCARLVWQRHNPGRAVTSGAVGAEQIRRGPWLGAAPRSAARWDDSPLQRSYWICSGAGASPPSQNGFHWTGCPERGQPSPCPGRALL